MQRFFAILVFAFLMTSVGCRRNETPKEKVYVAAQQVNLRDRVADVYNKVGIVKNGDALDLLERSKNKRWLRVRSPDGTEGWIEQKYVVGNDIFQALERLAAENRVTPVQGHATADTDLRMRAEPKRDADFIYMLREKDKVELLKRASTQKEGPKTDVSGQPIPPVYEDWWLVRGADHHVGWVVARNLDMDVPLEIAQYAEGQHIIAVFPLNEVEDKGKKVPQYLMAMSEPKGGLPYDFDQVKVFTWNAKKDHYEMAFREHIKGVLPIAVTSKDMGKEGKVPVFSLRVVQDNGPPVTQEYKMNGVMVRRVLAPGQEAPKSFRRGRQR